MPDNLSTILDEHVWVCMRELQHEVLLYLRDNGEINWATLYLHFNADALGEIGPVLGDLARSKHIKVEGDGQTTITALGLEHLEVTSRRSA
jgi:hypothetical protein